MSIQTEVDELLKLPWTWIGPIRVEEDGRVQYEIRIDELPEFIVAARRKKQAIDEAVPALRAYLESFVEHGETPPLPRVSGEWQVTQMPGMPVKATTDTLHRTASLSQA